MIKGVSVILRQKWGDREWISIEGRGVFQNPAAITAQEMADQTSQDH